MSILGRDILSQRKNTILLKITVQIVIFSFWLPNYIDTLVKHGFIEKIDHNIFRSIFETGYSIGISLNVGAFKKDIQQNTSIELTFISR